MNTDEGCEVKVLIQSGHLEVEQVESGQLNAEFHCFSRLLPWINGSNEYEMLKMIIFPHINICL